MSVFRRNDQRTPNYHYEFVLRGQRFKGSTHTASRRQALAFERSAKAAAALSLRHTVSSSSSMSVAEVFDRYWQSYGHELKDISVKSHLRDMEAHFGPGALFCKIDQALIAQMLESFAARSVRKNCDASLRPGRPSKATVNRRLAVLRRVHNIATEHWNLPTERIRWKLLMRKEPGPRVRHVSIEDGKRILSHLPTHIRLMVAWSLATGARLNETETLRWERINFETSQAEVFKKGGGTRLLDLSDDALAILRLTDRTRELVFDATNRRRHWEQALRSAGISEFRWHDLRHTFATWLGQRGAGLHVVQKALGHSKIETTMRYLHVLRSDVREAVCRLPRLVE